MNFPDLRNTTDTAISVARHWIFTFYCPQKKRKKKKKGFVKEEEAEAVILGFEQDRLLSLSEVREAVYASSRKAHTRLQLAIHLQSRGPCPVSLAYLLLSTTQLLLDTPGEDSGRPAAARIQLVLCHLSFLFSSSSCNTAVCGFICSLLRWGRGWLGRRGGSRAIQGCPDIHAPLKQIHSIVSRSRWILVEEIHFPGDSS